jgi:hypothetical protein
VTMLTCVIGRTCIAFSLKNCWPTAFEYFILFYFRKNYTLSLFFNYFLDM